MAPSQPPRAAAVAGVLPQERRVGDPDRNGLGGVAGEVAQSDVADLVLDMPVPAPGGDRADTGVGAVGIDRQHQPLGQHLDR